MYSAWIHWVSMWALKTNSKINSCGVASAPQIALCLTGPSIHPFLSTYPGSCQGGKSSARHSRHPSSQQRIPAPPWWLVALTVGRVPEHLQTKGTKILIRCPNYLSWHLATWGSTLVRAPSRCPRSPYLNSIWGSASLPTQREDPTVFQQRGGTSERTISVHHNSSV